MNFGNYAVGAEYSGDLFSPGTVLDEMNLVDAFIERVNRDVSASRVGPTFKQGWDRFFADWKKFYKDQGWLKRALNKTYAQVLEYREQAVKWSQEFKRLGGTLTGPPIKAGSEKPVNWKLALGLGVGVGLLVWWGIGRSRS